jgi:hypothetical protein
MHLDDPDNEFVPYATSPYSPCYLDDGCALDIDFDSTYFAPDSDPFGSIGVPSAETYVAVNIVANNGSNNAGVNRTVSFGPGGSVKLVETGLPSFINLRTAYQAALERQTAPPAAPTGGCCDHRHAPAWPDAVGSEDDDGNAYAGGGDSSSISEGDSDSDSDNDSYSSVSDDCDADYSPDEDADADEPAANKLKLKRGKHQPASPSFTTKNANGKRRSGNDLPAAKAPRTRRERLPSRRTIKVAAQNNSSSREGSPQPASAIIEPTASSSDAIQVVHYVNAKAQRLDESLFANFWESMENFNAMRTALHHAIDCSASTPRIDRSEHLAQARELFAKGKRHFDAFRRFYLQNGRFDNDLKCVGDNLDRQKAMMNAKNRLPVAQHLTKILNYPNLPEELREGLLHFARFYHTQMLVMFILVSLNSAYDYALYSEIAASCASMANIPLKLKQLCLRYGVPYPGVYEERRDAGRPSCNCADGCLAGRCRCMKAGLECWSGCHQGLAIKNCVIASPSSERAQIRSQKQRNDAASALHLLQACVH